MPGYYVMRFGKSPHYLVGNAAGLKEPVYTQVSMMSSASRRRPPSNLKGPLGSLNRHLFLLETSVNSCLSTTGTFRVVQDNAVPMTPGFLGFRFRV